MLGSQTDQLEHLHLPRTREEATVAPTAYAPSRSSAPVLLTVRCSCRKTWPVLRASWCLV